MNPTFHGSLQKLAAFALLAIALLGFAGLSFDGKSNDHWESAIWHALKEDSQLTQVFPRVDASTVKMHGIIGDIALLPMIEAETREAFPHMRTLDLSEIRLARAEPWLEVQVEEDSVVIRGAINDRELRARLIENAKEATAGHTIESELAFDPGVRTEGWVQELSEILPEMMILIQTGGVEVRGQRWTLSGQTSSRKDFQKLTQTWEALVPAEAMLDITGLRNVEAQADVVLPKMGIRPVSREYLDPNRREQELWEAYEQSRRLRSSYQTQSERLPRYWDLFTTR